VREAYLSQYSESVTVEEAFNNFFGSPKWSTYEKDGYSYVVFKGVFSFNDKQSDARIVFKVTGDNFVVDQLDINGEEQDYLVTLMMLSKVYEDY
jgi:hypothetical protein